MGKPIISVPFFPDLLGSYLKQFSCHIGIIIVLDLLSKFHFFESIKTLVAINIVAYLEERKHGNSSFDNLRPISILTFFYKIV